MMDEPEIQYDENGQAVVSMNIVDESDPSGETSIVIPHEYYNKVLSGECIIKKVYDEEGKMQMMIVPTENEEENQSIDTLNKVISNTSNLHSIDQSHNEAMEVLQNEPSYDESNQQRMADIEPGNYTITEYRTDSLDIYKVIMTNDLRETVFEKEGMINESLILEFSGSNYEYTISGVLEDGSPRQTTLLVEGQAKVESVRTDIPQPGQVIEKEDMSDMDMEEFRISEITVLVNDEQKQEVTILNKDGMILDKQYGVRGENVKLQALNQVFEYTIQEDYCEIAAETTFMINKANEEVVDGIEQAELMPNESVAQQSEPQTNIDPAENWGPSELSKEEYSAIREKARSVAAMLESNGQLPSIQPYSEQLGSKGAYDDIRDLVERYKSRDEECRSDLISLRKHSKLFIPMKANARKLTRTEWATNEAAAQVCRYIPALLFHKRKLFECAATVIENTGLFPDEPSLRQGSAIEDNSETYGANNGGNMQQIVNAGLDDMSGVGGGGNMGMGGRNYPQIMNDGPPGAQGYMGAGDIANSNMFAPNFQNFGKRDLQLTANEEVSIKTAAERLQEELYQYPIDTPPTKDSSAVENQIHLELPRLAAMLHSDNASEIEQAHEYLRESSSVNGRFLAPQRSRAQPLSPYDVAVNEAAYHLVKNNIGLLVYRKVLSDLAKKVVRSSGCNFRHTTMGDKNFRDYNTSNLWLYNQENIPELDLTPAIQVLSNSLEDGPLGSVIGSNFVPVIEETPVFDCIEDEEDDEDIYKPDEFLMHEKFGNIVMTCEPVNNVLGENVIFCHTGTDDLKKVRILNFQNFSFTSIRPMDMNMCYNLVELNLYNNALAYLPRCLFLPNLTKLNLQKNRFVTVPLLEQFPKLYSVEIDDKIVRKLNMESLAFFCTELVYINTTRFTGTVSDELNAVLVDARASIESMVQSRWEEDLSMYFKKGVAKSEVQKVVETLVLGVRERKIYNEENFFAFKDLIARKVSESFLESKIIEDDEDDDVVSKEKDNDDTAASLDDDNELEDIPEDSELKDFKRSVDNNVKTQSKRNEFENQKVEKGQILLHDESLDRLTNVVGQALRSGKTVVYTVMRTAARQPGGDLIPVGGCDANDTNTTSSAYLMSNKKPSETDLPAITNTNTNDSANLENQPPVNTKTEDKDKPRRRPGPASFKKRVYGIDPSEEKEEINEPPPQANVGESKLDREKSAIKKTIFELFEMVDDHFVKRRARSKKTLNLTQLTPSSNKENYEKKLSHFKMPKTLNDISRDVPNLANIPTTQAITGLETPKPRPSRQKEFSDEEMAARIDQIVNECTEPILPSKMRELLGLDKRGRSSKVIKNGSDLTFIKHGVPIPESGSSNASFASKSLANSTLNSLGNSDLYSPSKSVLASTTNVSESQSSKQFNTRVSNKYKRFDAYGDDNWIPEIGDDPPYDIIDGVQYNAGSNQHTSNPDLPKDDMDYEPASKLSKTTDDSSPTKTHSSLGGADATSESSFINDTRKKSGSQHQQHKFQQQQKGEIVELPVSSVFKQPDYTKLMGLSQLTASLSSTKQIADYDPLHFIRCHARDNDPSDCNTKVWRCAFEPHSKNPYTDTTAVVATCGGECVCLIDCRSGKVMKRFKSREEEFYTVAWTTVEVQAGHQVNILAAAGKSKDIRLLHPEQLVCYSEMKGHQSEIACMAFHPRYPTVLFSGDAAATIIVWDIGIPKAPDYTSNYRLLARLMCPRPLLNPILNLVVMSQHDALVAGCEDGVFVWCFPEFRQYAPDEVRNPDFEVKVPTHQEPCFDGLARLTDNMILVKCVEEGEIFTINFALIMQHYKQRKFDESRRVVAEILVRMRWQITDEIYINVSSQNSLASVSCGDNEGTIWLYDMCKQAIEEAAGNGIRKSNMKPIKLLEWPECSVESNDKAGPTKDDANEVVGDNGGAAANKETTKNPIINCVEMSSDGQYLVAVTDNNLVCIWTVPVE